MCDVWCVMCDVPDLIFCKILTIWVKGRPKHPIWVISDLFNEITKWIPGGSRMYTISCKASYKVCPDSRNRFCLDVYMTEKYNFFFYLRVLLLNMGSTSAWRFAEFSGIRCCSFIWVIFLTFVFKCNINVRQVTQRYCHWTNVENISLLWNMLNGRWYKNIYYIWNTNDIFFLHGNQHW